MASNPPVVFDAPERTKRAKAYEEKTAGILNVAMKLTAEHEATMADAAAIIEHGPGLATALGDLADKDEKVRKAIDFITSGTENPYAAVAMAAIPLIAQVMRNHEDAQIDRVIGLRIPFTKREIKFNLKWRLKLRNPFVRATTVPPDTLNHAIYGNPEIMSALVSQGIEVPWKAVNRAARSATARETQ